MIFSDEQTRLLREARQDSDIVLNGATHDPREGKEYLKLVDTQLMKAQNYLYSELQLPELEIPEIPENTEENPSNNSETNSGQDNRRPFKRPKKRQLSE